MIRNLFGLRLNPSPILVILVVLISACGSPATSFSPQQTPAPAINQSTPSFPVVTETPVAAIPESRRVVLEWPAVIRSGDSDTIRLALEMDTQGNLTPTAIIAGHEVSGEKVQVPNLYETHHIFAEARLDMAGLQVSPNDMISQSLLPGQDVTFYWSVSPDRVSTYRGVVWLYLRFIPIHGGIESRRAISAQRIEIRSVDLFGLSGNLARIAGGIGTVIGAALGLDNLIPWIWNMIRRKKVE